MSDVSVKRYALVGGPNAWTEEKVGGKFVLATDYTAQSLELQAVREALRDYGRHSIDCGWKFPPHYECDCGLGAALKQSRGATP